MAEIESDIEVAPGVRIPRDELSFAFSRSGGKGGQNVNKVETKVELRFDVVGSRALRPELKARLMAKLGSRIDADGTLRIVADEARTQLANRVIAVERFQALVAAALRPVKKRRATKPTRSSQERRMTSKKVHGAKKSSRRWRGDE